MDHRCLLFAAALATGATVLAPAVSAETVATDSGIAVKPSAVATPSRGMTMDDVVKHYGAPASKVPAVGRPPISRWEYPGFVVYFESDHVIHSVVANS